MSPTCWVVDTSAIVPLIAQADRLADSEMRRRNAGEAFLLQAETGGYQLLVPAVVVTELLHGADCERELEIFLARPWISVVPIGRAEAVAAGRAARHLSGGDRQRIKFDACIAGVAIAREVPSIISYDAHFGRVPGLKVSDWPDVPPLQGSFDF